MAFDMLKVGLQNVSSVQCYLWDISLLYAQRRDLIELARQISHLHVSHSASLMSGLTYGQQRDTVEPVKQISRPYISCSVRARGQKGTHWPSCLPQVLQLHLLTLYTCASSDSITCSGHGRCMLPAKEVQRLLGQLQMVRLYKLKACKRVPAGQQPVANSPARPAPLSGYSYVPA